MAGLSRYEIETLATQKNIARALNRIADSLDKLVKHEVKPTSLADYIFATAVASEQTEEEQK